MLYVAWTFFRWGGDEFKTLISYASFFSLGLVSIVLALRASKLTRLDSRTRWAWRIIALVVVLRTLGNVIGFYHEFVLRISPGGTWAEIPYLAYYPVLLFGVLMFPMKQRRGKTWLTFGLDAGTVMGGAGMVIWYLFLRPIASAEHKSLFESAIALAYPVCDLVLLFGIVAVVLRRPEATVRRALNILTLSMILDTASDLGYGYLLLNGGYKSGEWIDAIYLVSYYLVALGAHQQYWQGKPERTAESASDSDNRMLIWLPYSGIALGYGLLWLVTFNHWQENMAKPLHTLVFGAMGLTVLVIVRQITAVRENARLLAERATRQKELRFRSLVQNASDVIMILDAGMTIQFESPSAKRTLGYDQTQLVGTKLTDLLHPDDAPRARAFLAESALKPGVTPPIEWRLKRRDGTWLHGENIGTNLIHDPNVCGIVINTRDISERKILEEQLTHQAFHDPLTGLANRALFRNRVEHALARARSNRESIAVLFLDLDNFKTINDSLGHTEGDYVLVTVAGRLQGCLRAGDTAARLGGDEFAVLLEDAARAAEAEPVAERIIDAFSKPVLLNGKEVSAGLSVGIAVSSSNCEDADALLRDADVAMYVAKSCGKGRYELFAPSMHTAALERLELEGALRHAVEHKEFTLHYQPIVELLTGRIMSLEALLRWHHPSWGSVSPATFIPFAEETGLIVPLGQWVLEQACQQCRLWQQRYQNDPPLAITVNISGRQLLDPNVIETISTALQRSGLEPQYLTLEITESVMMQDTQAALEKLQQMKEIGVRLALDDFGTGYSSLSYLQRFPIDILKIDKAFVEGINNKESEESALVQAIITLAETLHLHTVAEGIELPEQSTALQELGCEFGQGYHFAKPLAPKEIEVLLQQVANIESPILPLNIIGASVCIPLRS